MFEHFTFGAPAQTSYLQPEDSYPSPTDCSFRLPTPPPTSNCEGEGRGGINDIVNQFSSQSLRPSLEDERPQRSIWLNDMLEPDFDDEEMDFTGEELSYTSSNHGTVSIPQHTQSLPDTSQMQSAGKGTVTCRRLQRQLNVQLQSCNTHIRDITALVEEMIATSSQCRLRAPASKSTSSSPATTDKPVTIEPLELEVADDEDLELAPQPPHEDEGFAEMDDDDEAIVGLRRASAPTGIRKSYGGRWRADGSLAGSSNESGSAWRGRKVRSVPRMRRRKAVVATVTE